MGTGCDARTGIRRDPLYNGHHVYRLWNADDVCLYVGVSSNMLARLGSHIQQEEWRGEVSRIEISRPFWTRWAAEDEEREQISKLRPVYNVTGSNSDPVSPPDPVIAAHWRTGPPVERNLWALRHYDQVVMNSEPVPARA